MSAVYQPWGFRDNLFTTDPLRADGLGSRLFVGREQEINKITLRLGTRPQCVALEGSNGIGKTSLVNVATHRALVRYTESRTGPFLIPCGNTFQLEKETIDADEFIISVLLEVAQTFIKHKEPLKNLETKVPSLSKVNQWLNSAAIDSFQGGFQAGPFVGLSFGKNRQPSSSEGFLRSGFQNEVLNWLSALGDAGGNIVCILDNMELLKTSKAAREVVEILRDKLLQVNGLRWVLCGSTGIVRGILSTPRMAGFLYEPLELEELKSDDAPRILEARIDAFRSGQMEPYLPLRGKDFTAIYDAMKGNLRTALSMASNYCFWILENAHHPIDDAQKEEFFSRWFDDQCRKLFEAVDRRLAATAWGVFDKATELQSFSPSDNEVFGFDDPQGLRNHVRPLEEAGLLISLPDDTDRRRKTVHVSDKGWMVDRWRRKRG